MQYSHYQRALNVRSSEQTPRSTKKISISLYGGWFIFLIGNGLNFCSLRFTAQTVLSALGSIQFIANIINIYILFKIKPTKSQIFGTLLIIIGITFILLLSNLSTYSQLTVDQIVDLFKSKGNMIYLICVISISIIIQCIYYYLKRKEESMNNNNGNDNNKNGLLFQEENDTELNLFLFTTKSKLIMSICYALISTMIGTQSAVFSKCIALILTQLDFKNFMFYLLIILWICSMLFWLYRMNKSLYLYKSVFIIPLLQVLWMIFSIISTGLFFKEINKYKWYDLIAFIISIIIVSCGVYFLSPPTKRDGVDNLLTSSTWNFLFPVATEVFII